MIALQPENIAAYYIDTRSMPCAAVSLGELGSAQNSTAEEE